MRKTFALGAISLVICACAGSQPALKGKALVASGLFFDEDNKVEAYLWNNDSIAIFNGMVLKNESTTPVTVKAISVRSIDKELGLVGYRIVRASDLELGWPFSGICANSFPPPWPESEPVVGVKVPVGESIAPIVAVRNPRQVSHAKLEGMRVLYEQDSKSFFQEFNFKAQYLDKPGRCTEK